MSDKARNGGRGTVIAVAAVVEADEEEGLSKEWLTGVQATWDNVREDEGGLLHVGDALQSQRLKRRRVQSTLGQVKRGMVSTIICMRRGTV